MKIEHGMKKRNKEIMNNRKIINTDRLTIVPMELKYLQSTHEYAADLENTKYMLNLPNETIDETKGFILCAEEEWSKEEPKFFEYVIIMDGIHVGAISLDLDAGDMSSAELGWTVNKKYWKRGICTEAARALVKNAIENSGINRFIARCDSENLASRAVMEKIGMVKIDEYGGRFNKQSTEERRECLYEMIIKKSIEGLTKSKFPC